MWKCPNCGHENDDDAKFCEGCGSPMPQAGQPAGGVAMGDKNVIAGDVVNGDQDNRKYFGNVTSNTTNTTNTVNTTNTTVINQDETKKVVTCHICGRNLTIAEAIICPECRQVTCESCYDLDAKLCKKCVADKKAKAEECYRQHMFHMLGNGIISAQERGELLQLKKQLGLSDERAAELEKICRSEHASGRNSTAKPFSMFEKFSLDKAKSLLWEDGDVQEAWKLIDDVYRRHKFDDEVVALRIQCAQAVLPPDQLRALLREIQADIPAAYLASIDLALQEGKLSEAGNLIDTAEGFWKDDYLITCRRALFFLAMADQLNDDSLIRQARDLMAGTPEPTDKMARSWKIKTMNSIAFVLGDAQEAVTPESCKEQDLYYRIASTVFISSKRKAEMEAAEERECKAAALFSYADSLLKGDGVARDEARAVEVLKEAAELGYADAQFRLGECYGGGHGVEQDDAEAVKWYRKAAEQGHADAQNKLGECCYLGNGTEQDYAEAVKWLRKAAEQGHADAQHNLGACYYNGNGVEQDSAEAVKWLRKAAEQGHADAQYFMNRLAEQTIAVKLRAAAEEGDAAAQFDLGKRYYNGDGVEKDHAEAVKWYRKAAEQGHADAQNALGDCCYFGNGTAKDWAEAVKWYRKAAEQGHADAQNNLGICYKNGRGVTQDYAEAVKWYRKAAEQGYAAAQNSLGVCCENGEGVEKNLTEAVKWYRKAAEQGHANAQNNLGICYENGKGVEKNLTEAVKWYRKAAEQGNAAAQFNLGLCYKNGEGVEKDLAEAVKWYRKAAEQGHAYAQKKLVDLEQRLLSQKIMICANGALLLLWLLGFFYVWQWQGPTGIRRMPNPGSSIMWYWIIAAFFIAVTWTTTLFLTRVWGDEDWKDHSFAHQAAAILFNLIGIALTCLIFVFSVNFTVFSWWVISAIVLAVIAVVLLSIVGIALWLEYSDSKDLALACIVICGCGALIFLLCWLLCYPFTVSGKENLARSAENFPEYREYYLQRAAESRQR